MNGHKVSPVTIGRDTELRRLRQAFTATVGGTSSTVLVTGEAGVGKSRLVEGFQSEVAGSALVLNGCGVDLGTTELPFAAVTAALRGVVAELGADGVRELVGEHAIGTLAPILPGVAGPGTAGATQDARARMFEYTLELLARLAERRTCVLVIEDVHWLDRSSRDLLDFLVRGQSALAGLMIVLTHRSDEVGRAHPLRRQLGELARLPWVDRIDLDRLPRRHVVAQVRQLVEGEPDAEVLNSIYTRSGGNPLFVEALAACLRDTPECDVPPSLADILLERVERLPEHSVEIVRAASVAGERVGHPLLAQVIRASDVDPSAMNLALRSAMEGSVLTVEGEGYAFRHALIREAVYGDLLPGERATWHARYAEALAGDRALATRGHAEAEIAHHLFAADDPERAVPAAWRASKAAADSLAYAEELTLVERILELWPNLDDPAAEVGASHVEVLERATEAALRAGAHNCGEALATRALDELDPDAERVRMALMLERRGTMRTSLGLPTALDDLREAVRVIPREHPARAFLLDSLATRLMQVPLPDEAEQVATEALAIARDIGDAASEASATITLAVIKARRGDLDAQLDRFGKARALAESVSATEVVLRAWHSESHLLHAGSRLDEAAALAREGLAAAKDAGLARAKGPTHVIDLVGPLIGAGRWDEALDAIGYGLTLVPAPNDNAHLLCQKAFIALNRGDLAEADALLVKVDELMVTDHAFVHNPVLFDGLEADLRRAQGRTGEALDALDRVLARDHLAPATRFLWPLLVGGLGTASDAMASDDPVLRERGTGMLARLRDWAGRLNVTSPVQAAWQATFAAEIATTQRDDAPAAWREAVAAWEALGQPLRLSNALIGAAAAGLAVQDDRAAIVRDLKRAVAMADDLGAQPLREQVDSLTRRAGIALEARPRQSGGAHGLTARELEILRLVADGRSNSEIAGELFIAPKTASVHVSHILAKLGVGNRVEAAAAAHRLGLLDPAAP